MHTFLDLRHTHIIITFASNYSNYVSFLNQLRSGGISSGFSDLAPRVYRQRTTPESALFSNFRHIQRKSSLFWLNTAREFLISQSTESSELAYYCTRVHGTRPLIELSSRHRPANLQRLTGLSPTTLRCKFMISKRERKRCQIALSTRPGSTPEHPKRSSRFTQVHLGDLRLRHPTSE